MSLPAVNLDKTKLSPSEGHTAFPFVLRRMRLTSTASVALVVIGLTRAQEVGPGPAAPENQGYADPSLRDELQWLEAEKVYVTSVSKHSEDAFKAAAAVSVISNEDIRRSGARSLPEALRLAPGLSVARINANKTAVASRGFSNIYAEHLLVLVDGRSVYQVNNSGVNWILEDTLLEDIERIEVVRGPGGTLWGANAVNGVINIVTKSSRQATGAYASAGVGTEQRAFAEGRFGDRLGDWGFMRGYVKYQDRAPHPGGYDWQRATQGGVRLDRETDDYRVTLSSDAMGTTYGDKILIPAPPVPIGPFSPKTPVDYRGERGNVRANFNRSWSDDTSLDLQAFYDHSRDRSTTLGSIQGQDVYDVDGNVRFPVAPRLNSMFGLGYRYLPSNLNDHRLFSWVPNDRNQQLFSAFLHNEWDVAEERLKVSFGTKLEHNDFTGFEWAPNVRLAWTPDDRHTVWSAVSRAVQVPGRIQNDMRVNSMPIDTLPPVFGLPVFVSYSGNPAVRAQELVAYELGYRFQPVESWSMAVATYNNVYNNLIYGAANPAGIHPGPTGDYWVIPSSALSGGHGQTQGGEVSLEYRPSQSLRIRPAYTLFNGDLIHPIDGYYVDGRKDPKHQVSLWSQFNLPGEVDLDIVGRWVSGLRGRFQTINGYFGLNVRLGWRPSERWEIALVGQNLVNPNHVEYVEDTGVRAEVTAVPRGGYLQVTLRF